MGSAVVDAGRRQEEAGIAHLRKESHGSHGWSVVAG